MRHGKSARLRNCFLMLLMIISVVFAGPVKADTITIVADPWYPYNGTPGTPEPGYGIEIAQLVFQTAGHLISYKVIPWNRAIIETRKGYYNAIIGANIEDAPDFIFPEEEFGVSKRNFWAKKGSPWRFEGLESLAQVRIGVIKDYSYGQELNAYFKSGKRRVQYAFGDNALEMNINKLLAGRIDTTVENENVFLQKVKEMDVSDQVISVGSIGAVDNLYIAFSPKIGKSREYAEIVTNGIRKLNESGKLQEILLKYGLPYWK